MSKTEVPTKRLVQHATAVLERLLDAPAERVFVAFANAEQRLQWDRPGKDWVPGEVKMDFRVNGRDFWSFGPPGDPFIHSEGHFLNIVPTARFITARTMHAHGDPISCTLLTVELYVEGDKTRLILTDQSAYVSWETPQDRKSGWGEIVDRLEEYLATYGAEGNRDIVVRRIAD